MTKQQETKDQGKKIDGTSKGCVGDAQPKGELDGKNDSGPEPEIHGREIPPQ